MKTEILSIDGGKTKQIELPKCFGDEVRKDIIKKAFEANVKRQPYGAFYLAGKQASASGQIKHARRKWKTAYGHGISRVPRKIMTRRGAHFFWVGAFVSGARKGRQAHPPKPEKVWTKNINKKEKLLAIRSAISATSNLSMLVERYKFLNEMKNKINISLPIVVESKISEIKKTSELKEKLQKILGALEQIAFRNKEVRAGKGKKRGRKYKVSRGLLIVSAKPIEAAKGLRGNGVDAVTAKDLNVSLLAPGAIPGRLTIYTEDAIEEMKKNKKFA